MQALWMVLAAFFFATMGVCIKFASEAFNAAEMVFYRGIIGILFMALLARSQKVALSTRYPGMHAWRSAIGVTSMMAWFYAISKLPLATAMTLNYMSSVWIAAFLVGGAMLTWRPGRDNTAPPMQISLVLTVLAGFAGVVMMLRPSLNPSEIFGGLIGLLSGMSSAFAYMQVMALSRMGEPETRTVFYFAVGSTIAGAIGMVITGLSPWDWNAAVWLVPIGVLAALGQLSMTRAYSLVRSKGEMLVVANLQYSGIVFAGIYSTVVFSDDIPLIGWIGMAIIITSGIVATLLRARAAPDAPAEEH
ncbi:DMT family transporter [Variovorax sp. HJSM1_2]|uniref:DMT family transporter n=1 Tax=Variovorax sp. HJSM1_2 TaxID=3366263 RepID=UPI003BC09E6C